MENPLLALVNNQNEYIKKLEGVIEDIKKELSVTRYLLYGIEQIIKDAGL